MPRTCTVCRLPDRQKVDEALIAGEPLRGIAKRFGTSQAAIGRHKDAHLPARLVEADKARQKAGAKSSLDMLVEIIENTLRLGKKAERSGDLRTAVAAFSQGMTKIVELQARIRGEIGGAQVEVNINAPESLEEARRHVTELLVSFYRRDPGGFLESLRRDAAKMEAERRRIPYEQARADLEARERRSEIHVLPPADSSTEELRS